MSTPYPKEPISPLRARMIEDMRIRNFALATQRGYIRGVKMSRPFCVARPTPRPLKMCGPFNGISQPLASRQACST